MTTVPDNPRGRLLMRANECVNKERNASYGDPNADFRRIAAFWNVYIHGVIDKAVQDRGDRLVSHPQIEAVSRQVLRPHDVAVMLMLMKASRLVWSPEHADSWVDVGGYAACGWDVVVNDVLRGDDELPSLLRMFDPLDPGVIDPDFQRILDALGISEPDSLHDILDRIGKLRAAEEYLLSKDNIGEALG